MKTIGSRLTGLYVGAVAGTLCGVLVLGHLLLEHQLVENLDAQLRQALAQVQDRIGADAESGDVQALLAVVGVQPIFTAEAQDLWDDPAYRAARSSGTIVSASRTPRFFNVTEPGKPPRRAIEVTIESLRIRLLHPLDAVERALATYTRWGAAMTLVVLALSWLAGLLLSRAALAPVRSIERTAARITSSNLSERIPIPPGRDEISNLARLLNETFDRLEASFAQIERFSADASHELKTPLSLIRLNLERVVLRDRVEATDRAALQDAIEEIHHLDRLTENLLFLARAESGEVALDRRALATAGFIEDFAGDARTLAEASAITFVVVANEPITADVDPARIRQVLLNLLSNALKFSPPGGRIELRSTGATDHWKITLQDEGPGVPAGQLERIFQRFSRLPSEAPIERPGAGLGLALSRMLVELHDGSLRAIHRPDRSGLIVECVLPLKGV